MFARLGEQEKADAVARLRIDLETGVWQARNAELLALEELDLGYRLLVAEL